jgi:ABC-type sugar transport system substrate-binding protein
MSKRSILAVPVAVAMAFAFTACASESGGGGSSASGDPAAAQCVSTVEKAVDEARAPLPLIVPDKPLDLAKVEGKSLWVINVLTNQFITDANKGFEAAAKAAGADVTIFDGQGTANGWNEGIQQAIAQKADAIALFGIDSEIVSESVQEAIDDGIPVMEALAVNYDTERKLDLFTTVSADYYADAAAMANWTLADSKCTANTYVIYSTALPIWVDMLHGALDTYKENCPTCVISDVNVDLANVATELPRVTQTKLTQSPDTEYLLATWDSAVPFIESAAAQVKADAKILARDGIDAALEEVRTDGMQKVTQAAPPPQWIAWVVIDDMLRSISDEQPNGIIVPTRLIDKTNVGKDFADVMPEYVDFEAAFEKAWGAQ